MTEDSFCRILLEVPSSLSLQMNLIQAQCSVECRRMQGAGKSCHRVCPVLLLLLSLSKESLKLVDPTTHRMCLAQMQVFCCLLKMVIFLSSLSESCSPEMEHLAYNWHGIYLQLQSPFYQGNRMVWSWHFCAAVSQPCWLLGPGGCLSTFPKWMEKQKPQYFDDN